MTLDDAPPTAHSSRFPKVLVDTMASTAPDLLKALPDNVWASRAIVALQTFAIPVSFWFKPLCVCIACFWLVYRAYQVLNKPLEELAGLLGFDIPLTPRVDLASIKADGAIIHWSLPQAEKLKGKSKLKFDIHLNGTVIESVSSSESAVTITGLQPSSFYVVRVALVNEQEFAGRSEPVRFRTKAASTNDFFVVQADGHETDHEGEKEVLPRVRLYRGLKDITPASPEPPPMTREASSNGLASRRSVGGRRSIPAVTAADAKHESQAEEDELVDGVETLQQLTDRLDVIRRETDEAERMAKEEEEEEARLKEELAKERDELRAEVTEKEKASRNLKREVNTLERQNTAAQNERSKQERILGQKKQEREKLKDDMARWEREALELKEGVTRAQQEKTAYLEQMAQEKEKLQAKQAEEAVQAKAVEDAIKEKTAEIRKLERSLKDSSPDQVQQAEPNMVQQLQQDHEETQQWNAHMVQLRQQYGMVAQKLENAKRFYSEQTRYLESVRAERRREEELAEQQRQREREAQQLQSPVVEHAGTAILRRGDSQRSRRATSSDSPQTSNFPAPATSAPFGNVTVTANPWSSAPFMNTMNGMTIFDHAAPTSGLIINEEDKEKLTGGALMSPGAGAELLPADLFSGDGEGAQRIEPKVEEPEPEPAFVLPGLGALPGFGGMPVPAQQPLEKEHPGPGPASPASDVSRNPSVFASPQASQHNLYIGSPDNLMDADRRSVRSNRSGRVNSGTGSQPTGSRFSSMFGIKPRAKTTVNAEIEGPALGKAQSHSMPRQEQIVSGLDSTTMNRKRNSSISGLFGPDAMSSDGMSDAFSEAGQSGPNAPARKAFGMRALFSKDANGWPSSFSGFGRRPGSPRPGSTHSNELPRPSFDSSRWGVDTWPSQDATAGARSSPLSFGPVPAWPATTGQNSRWAGSRHPSRRPSVQYGASGPPEDIIEDDDSDFLPDTESHLAPIGTKPDPNAIAERRAEAATPKLNPAAKDFKSFFGIKSRDKNPGSSSAVTTPLASGSQTGTPGFKYDFDDESPPLSRKSRSDARSMTTTESSVAESGRNSTEYLARTPSHTTTSTDAAGSGPSPLVGSTGKESFMAKITRKSSSGKFGLPSFKRGEKSRLETGSATSGSPNIPPPMTPSEAEEEETAGDMSASATSLRGEKEKDSGRGSVRSWSNVLKRSGKGKGKEAEKEKGKEKASSVSGQSLTASEATDGEMGLGIEGAVEE